MEILYVVGGQQRSLRSLLAGSKDWYEYSKAVILRIKPETGQIDVCVEYISPHEVCPRENPTILFKSGSIQNDLIYVCTQTEVIIYSIHDFKRVGYLSLPCFNDLHHVRPTPEGNLLIANTGLDMVLETTLDGKVLREWNVLGESPWGRFEKSVDYRKVNSTKPHRSHPNHIFFIGDEIWVTRFNQKDAISIERPERRMPIEIERPHDGVVCEDQIYFTTVDGNIVIVKSDALMVEKVIDLNDMHDQDTLLGWCRGIAVRKGMAWVGFSRLRPTKFRENVSWVKNKFKRSLCTHLALYDLVSHKCIVEIDLEEYGLNAVFSILPVLQ